MDQQPSKTETLLLSDELGEVSISTTKSADPHYMLVLAHGAGAGLHHDFMKKTASFISDLHGHVARFNFPYMEAGKKFPGSPKPNIATIQKMEEYVLKEYPNLPVFLSGKSYGGRMSSHYVYDFNSQAKGLIYFGFPLHAPGKASKDRANHLMHLKIPQLFLQGTRDALANYELIEEVAADCPKATIQKIEHADHSFKVAKKLSGRTYDEMIMHLARLTDDWIMNQIS